MQIAAIAFLFSIAAHADGGRDAIRAYDRATEALKRLGNQECQTCNIAVAGQDDPPWKQCMDALCPDGYAKYGTDLLAGLLVDLTDPADKEILDLQEKAFEEDLKDTLESYQRALDLLKSGKKITDRNATVFANTMISLSSAGDFVYGADGKVDEDASRKKLIAMSQRDFDNALRLIRIIQSEQRQDPVIEGDYEFFVQTHTSAEIQTRINEALSTLEASRSKFEFAYGLPPEQALDSLKLEKKDALRSGIYTREDLEQLQEDIESAGALNSLLSHPLMLMNLSSASVDPAKMVPANAIKVLSERIAAIKKYLADPEKVPGDDPIKKRHEDSTWTCRVALQTAKKFYPTQDEVNSFRNRLTTYKNRFYDAMSSRMSSHSKGVLKSEMDNWKFAIPETYEQYRAGLKRRINSSIDFTHVEDEPFKKMQKERPGLFNAFIMMSVDDLDEDPKYGKDLEEACQNQAPEPLRDAALLGSDKMWVGAVSVRNDSIGSGIFKHEMGHLTSGIFQNGKMSEPSKGWYDSVRACLQKPKAKNQWVEEDWGDFASGISGGGAKGCYYFGGTEQEFSIKDPEDDVHSAGLYRILNRHQLVNGSIPDICTEALKTKGESFSLTNCDKESAPVAR